MLHQLLFLLLFVPLTAGIVGYTPIGILDRQADTIVAGTVTSVEFNGSRSVLTLRVSRVIRGAPTATEISMHMDGPVLDSANAVSLGERLWFLRGGTVVPRSNIQGIEGYSMPSVSPAQRSDLSPTSLESLQLEIVAVSRNDLDPATRNQVTHFLDNLLPAARQEVSRLLATSSKVTDTATVSRLLMQSSTAGIQHLVELARKQEVAPEIASALCGYRNPDPNSIAAISELWRTTRNPTISTCSVIALKAIHTPATVRPLLLILDSPSLNQRYLAVSGLYLSANSGNLPREEALMVDGQEVTRMPPTSKVPVGHLPPFETFRAEETTHIAFWKQWALTLR